MSKGQARIELLSAKPEYIDQTNMVDESIRLRQVVHVIGAL